MQVGTNKDQGLYNKPSAAVHPGALAAGTLPQYNTTQHNTIFDNSHYSLFLLLCPISEIRAPPLSHSDTSIIDTDKSPGLRNSQWTLHL